MRQRLDFAEAEGFKAINDMVGGAMVASFATNFVLPSPTPHVVIHTGGAINLRMPAGSLAIRGKIVWIVNNGSGAVTMQASDGTAFTSATAVAANTAAAMVATGDTAAASSWVALKQGT